MPRQRRGAPAVLGLTGEDVRVDVMRFAFLFQQLKHLNELAERVKFGIQSANYPL